ncbi:MAG: hypothetical protein ABSC23_20040 [Bryobacteraceae bacterium]|jgi:chaperonin cofactor prefoldin
MQLNTLTLKQADEQLATLETREAQLAAMLAQTSTRLAEVEATAGDAFLDGDERPMREVGDLRVRVDTLNAALEAIGRRKATTGLARRGAEVVDLRRQVAARKSELSELERKTSKLLAALSEIEGVRYTASILSSQPVGSWLTPGLYTGAPEPYLAARELFADVGATYGTPRSRSLRSEISDLERQAKVIEQELGSAE